jgi:hypothetical protein
MSKSEAHHFLKLYEESLQQAISSVASFSTSIRQRAAAAKNDAASPHLRRPEEVFLNEHAVPCLSRELQTQLKLRSDAACAALLSENYAHMEGICSTTPARTVPHPFDKTLAPNATAVIDHWRSGKSNALRQSCPDFALRPPCPFKIVFEGKYFDAGSSEKAATDLVRCIYQAFFYRALPPVPAKGERAAWDYDYACLLACDASPNGSLLGAWKSIPTSVREGFWEGASVYVMVLRGGT